MSYREFSELDTSKLKQFIALRIDEGHYIDYKITIQQPLGTAEKKELLKDTSGFANASGGIIIYGCEEPNDTNSWQTQLEGTSSGTSLSADMERVINAGMDPRIPGIDLRTIPLEDNKYAIVVYIPPSNIKPHMVTLQGSNRFYIRHSESTDPMTTSEVRTTVLSAYNRDDAIEKMRISIVKQANVSPNFHPTIIIQAIPLTELAETWNVYSEQIEDPLRGNARVGQFVPELSLRSLNTPTIQVEEVSSECRDDSPGGYWKIGVRSSGHVYMIHKGLPTGSVNDGFGGEYNHPYFTSIYNQIFCSFGALIDELCEKTGTAHGYRIYCELHQVGNLVLYRNSTDGFGQYHGPLDGKELQWPERNVPPGSSIESACSNMGETIYQAFHFLPLANELKVRGTTG